MDYADIVAITGMSGLYNVVAQRQNGMIVASLGSKKSKFVSSRQHNFTFLENVSIYTNDNDVAELKNVLIIMQKKEKTSPPPQPKADVRDLQAYFSEIVPDYDREKVYTSDIQKVIKWYNILKEHDLIKEEVKDKAEDKKKSASGKAKEEKSTKSKAKTGKTKTAPKKGPGNKATAKKSAPAQSKKKTTQSKKKNP